MTKNLYCVSVTRGRKTVYKYGEKMKDAVALLRLKAGEKFQYVKYQHQGVTSGEWRGATWVAL